MNNLNPIYTTQSLTNGYIFSCVLLHTGEKSRPELQTANHNTD